MSRPALPATLILVLGLGNAKAMPFIFPETIPGFTGRMAGVTPRPDSPLMTAAKEAGETCDSVTVYGYRDGPAATAGLTRWLAAQGLKPTEYLRTSTAVVWGAKTDSMELLGEWIAPTAGQPGRLELCQHSLAQEVTTRIPGQLIVWLLAGGGALGSAAGGLYDRFTEKRKAPAA